MILVTGGTGFIGSHLVERLSAHGERVRLMMHRKTALSGPAVEVVHCNLATGEGIDRALSGTDVVIHLAGVTRALSSADYYEGNVTATGNLATAVAAASANGGSPIRMIHISSLAAIGPSADGTPVEEDAEPHPVSEYGRSKLEGERTLRAILPCAVVLRPPVVYGPRDTDVFQLLKSINRGIVAQIAGGDRFFSAIYVHDLVDGILMAARQPKAAGRAYFLAHSPAASWAELGRIAARIMGRAPRTMNIPLGAARAVGYAAEVWARLTRNPGIVSRDKVREAQCRYWFCNTKRAKEELGFEAPTSIEDGLAATLAWYREAGWLKY
jgi:nucleoside-diphosphate-sugar epimerase